MGTRWGKKCIVKCGVIRETKQNKKNTLERKKWEYILKVYLYAYWWVKVLDSVNNMLRWCNELTAIDLKNERNLNLDYKGS